MQQLPICGIVAIAAFFFVHYLPEGGRKRPEHVGGILCGCLVLYLTVVHLLE